MTSEEGKSSSQGLARVDRDDPVDLQPVRLQDAVGGISIPPAPTAVRSPKFDLIRAIKTSNARSLVPVTIPGP